MFGTAITWRATPALENSQGQVIGATFVGVDITRTWSTCARGWPKVKVGDSGHVHAGAGRPRAQPVAAAPEHSGRPVAAQRDAHDQPAYAALLAGAAGAQAVSLADGEHLLRYAPYPTGNGCWSATNWRTKPMPRIAIFCCGCWAEGRASGVPGVAAMALTTHRRWSAALGEAAGALRRISQARDLTAGLPTRGRDEISALAQAFNGLQDALQHAL